MFPTNTVTFLQYKIYVEKTILYIFFMEKKKKDEDDAGAGRENDKCI